MQNCAYSTGSNGSSTYNTYSTAGYLACNSDYYGNGVTSSNSTGQSPVASPSTDCWANAAAVAAAAAAAASSSTMHYHHSMNLLPSSNGGTTGVSSAMGHHQSYTTSNLKGSNLSPSATTVLHHHGHQSENGLAGSEQSHAYSTTNLQAMEASVVDIPIASG